MSEKEQTGSFRKKANRWLIICLLVIIAILALILAFKGRESKPEIQAADIKQQLVEAEELTTVKYVYSDIGQFTDQKDFYGIKLPFTTKEFILAYDGILSAGVDLSQAEVQVEGKTVHIDLPHAKVLSHEIDESSFRLFDEKNSVFNPFSVQDYADFEKALKQEKEDKALASGLLQEAETNAQKIIYHYCQLNPTFQEGYDIQIRFGGEALPGKDQETGSELPASEGTGSEAPASEAASSELPASSEAN